MKIVTLHTFKTVFNADSVEWCPHEPHKNVFVCANYQLIEENSNKKRTGCILVFSTTKDTLKLEQTINTSAVLDQKWCHRQIDLVSILGVVTAEKTLQIYKLNANMQLELVAQFTVEDSFKETLLLSLDWSTGKYSDEPLIVCSDSNGRVHLFKFTNSELCLLSTWPGHEYEAWISAFYYWDPNVIFTGGDDSVLIKFDRRIGDGAISKNYSHQAGVTAIHSNAAQEFLVATGSYDTFLRLWDVRAMKNPLKDLKMPGTLWRLKWDPFRHKRLLAACMSDGAHIVDGDNLKISASYVGEHKSITYGIDWCHSNELIASCSFYDNLLCVSEVQNDTPN